MKISGTLYDATFVNSRKYGRHVRAPRGTYKKAQVNTTLSKNASRADVVAQTAKVVHDHIKTICAPYFKQSDLWPEFLKRLFKAESMALGDLLGSLTGLEMNSKYLLSTLIVPQLFTAVSKRQLDIQLAFQHHPLFPKKIGADSYFYTLHLLFINQKGEAIDTDGIETEWVQLQDLVPQYELSFEMPAKAHYYILILEVAAGLNNVPLDVLPGKGMRVMEVGSVNR